MLNFLNTYKLIKGKAAIGVELLFNTKDSFTLIAQELEVKKEHIEINKRWVDITLEELAKINTKKLPIYFSIGGKGIIHKKVKFNDYTKDQELLSQVLPNAVLKDFYLQKSNVLSNECWVSIIRKDLLDGLIYKFKEQNLFSVQVYLGPFILENIIPLVDHPVIKTTLYELLVENNTIIQMDSLASVSEGEEYNIEGEHVNSHELIAFGSGLSHFIPLRELNPILCNEITAIEEEFYNKNKYVAVGFSILVFFFLLTIGNMLLYNSYQTINNTLQYQVSSNKKYIDELGVLQNELLIKEEFVKNSGLTQASKVSFYADQIALSTPNSIQLNQLFINPLEKQIKKSEDILFNYNKIKLMGSVSSSIELNYWIKEIKKYKWVTDIIVISFIQKNIETAGEFEIEISIN
ncbi:MAG: hypothetical protein HYU68_13600 [Bacteroidetes bacterium]|nr:hypothetical protein [Bacteroidota bacterium]